MKHGTYVGGRKELKDQKALIKEFGDTVMAQFDDTKNVPHDLCHGWTLFEASEFKMDSIENESHGKDCNCLSCLPDPHARFQ